MSSLLLSLLESGNAVKLVPIINFVIVLLLITVGACIALGISSIHLYVLSALSLGLLTSINWFVGEYSRVMSDNAPKAQVDSSTEDKAIKSD